MARIYKLIIYFGYLAFLALLAAFYLGLSGVNFKWHKWAGISAFSLASIHLLLIWYKDFKVRLSRGKAKKNLSPKVEKQI
jgi:hypothetical protein